MRALETDAAQPADCEPRRSTTRLKTFVSGKIVFRDGSCSFGCVVRDISERGARVALTPGHPVPKRFYFLTSKHEWAFDAEVIWQRNMLLGLKFHHKLDLSEPQLLFLKRLSNELQPRP